MTTHQRKIIHIDMDCFYAAIEMRDNPHLRNKPIAVGGSAQSRGVLCTSNYIARQFGVRSAMATAYALKLCPQLILIEPHMEKYRQVSQEILQIFSQYTDIIETLSLDEAFLDVSTCPAFNGSATLIAAAIRQQIKQTQHITASAGIAPNKFLAKIASEWNKPDGQCVIPPHQIADFVTTLPVNKIFGVGKVTAKKMQSLNLHTCGDIQRWSMSQLSYHFGSFGERLYQLSRGIDDRAVNPHRERKSVSVEHTFAQDISGEAACLAELPNLFIQLQHRLKKYSNRRLHKQFIKIKFHDFHQTTVECTITELSSALFTPLLHQGLQRHPGPVRLLGIGVGFDPDETETFPVQLSLQNML